MSDDKHDCPKIGCPARIDFDVMACKRHWFTVPPTLRARVWRAWRSGDIDALLAVRSEVAAVLNGAAS